MKLPNERRIEIEPGLKRMILIEIIFPMVLLILGIYHGLMQVLYRSGMIHARQVFGLEYYQGLTLHGVVNAIVFTTFFAVAFGYAVIRFYLGRALNMTVAWLSFTLMVIGTLLAAAAILSGKASVLYTFYPPLRAHPAFYVGLTLVVVGSWIAFFNWWPAYFAWKREHAGEKMPLAVVGTFAAFIVWLIATIPVAIEIIFLLIPWSMGWVATVNVPLARMLFWFFGHPLVYFWLLPTYVMYYTMLPKLSGGKLFSDFAGRLTFLWLVLYSAQVGIHHDAGGDSKFRDRIYSRRVHGTWRAREWWPRAVGLVEETSVPRQGSLAFRLFLLRPVYLPLRRSHRDHQRLV
jgi:cytochrome c oxidase subunit 1